MNCELYTLYIKRYREMRRMTQAELAGKIDKSQSYIAMLERPNVTRNKSPRLATITLIAKALDVCCDDLVRFKCEDCWRFNKCKKHQDLENDDEFFKEHLEYYI